MILKVGDTQIAACETCRAFEAITFKLRNVPFSDGSGIVSDILVGVCDKCESVVTLPHQSTPAVKSKLDQQRKSVESRIPSHMIDILNLASNEISGGIDFVPSLVKFYIHALSTNEMSPEGMSDFKSSPLFQGKSQKRLSIKGRMIVEEIQRLKEITSILKTTDLLKSVILKINDDLLIHKNDKSIKQLKDIVAVTA